MDIQVEKLNIIERFRHIDDISLINTIKSILDYAQKEKSSLLNYELKEKLSSRALKSEKNIKSNEVLNFSEIKDRTEQFLNR